MDRKELESLPREALIEKATALGVVRPRALTVAELIDEILRVEKKGAAAPRGWFGRARDLLTSVIDRGLGTDVRRTTEGRPVSAGPPPIPTVTLAEIYAAQGHLDRAIATLDEVLAKDPAHAEAIALRERFVAEAQKTKPSSPPPVLVAVPAPVEGARTAVEGEPAPVEGDPAASGPAATEPAGDDAGEAGAAAAPADASEPDDELPPFEVDEIVALAVDPHTVYLYWEVRPSTFARARAEDAHGTLVIRVATVVASDPTPSIRDVPVDALFGELFLHGVPAEANVRVSVGYKTSAGAKTLAEGAPVTTGEPRADLGDGFVPYAIGSAITTPRATPSEHVGTAEQAWSDAQLPSRAEGDGGWAGGDGDEGIHRRFPAGVWVEPALRVVHVATMDEAGGDTLSATSWTRGGASDLVRRDIVWGSETRAVSSYVHAR